MDRPGYAAVSTMTPALRLEAGASVRVDECVAEETPVSLAFNGVAQAVMIATPADLEDFAMGFAITEGFVKSAGDLSSLRVVKYSRGVEIQIETRQPVTDAYPRRRLAGRTGCGICGKDDIDAVLRAIPSITSTSVFTASAIARAMRELAEQQALNRQTGGVHAAGWSDADGAVTLVREDVGRHNALDKLIGALVRKSADCANGFVVMTSRGSFELVQKVAVLGAPLLCTVSAPTALAIRVAHDAGISLAGFARDSRVTLYAHEQRVTPT